jgi:hypothetical protein
MNDLPRTILKDLVRCYGLSLIGDALRTEGLLRDTCGEHPREIFVLVHALRQQIPADLLACRQSLPLPVLKGILARRLEDELSYSEQASRWAVESWAEALGLPGESSSGDTATNPAAATTPDPAVHNDDLSGDKTRQQLADDLESPGLESRLRAVTDLALLEDTQSIRLLIGALENGNWQVRRAAFDALSERGTDAIPVLLEALNDTSDAIIWRVVLVLGFLQTPDGVDPLISLLGKSGVIRECAIWSLGEMGDARASGPLLKFLQAQDPVVSREAAEALRKIGNRNGRFTKSPES